MSRAVTQSANDYFNLVKALPDALAQRSKARPSVRRKRGNTDQRRVCLRRSRYDLGGQCRGSDNLQIETLVIEELAEHDQHEFVILVSGGTTDYPQFRQSRLRRGLDNNLAMSG